MTSIVPPREVLLGHLSDLFKTPNCTLQENPTPQHVMNPHVPLHGLSLRITHPV